VGFPEDRIITVGYERLLDPLNAQRMHFLTCDRPPGRKWTFGQVLGLTEAKLGGLAQQCDLVGKLFAYRFGASLYITGGPHYSYYTTPYDTKERQGWNQVWGPLPREYAPPLTPPGQTYV
jgi:hypothetical protein